MRSLSILGGILTPQDGSAGITILSDDQHSLPHLQHVDDHRNRLSEAIGFSRWFIVTYQAVAVGFVVIVTISKQYERWTRARRWGKKSSRRRQRKDEDHLKSGNLTGVTSPSSSSSGSSARDGDITPPDNKIANEWTSLLDSKAKHARPRRSTAWRRLRSYYMYQPPPLPILNRVVPPASTIINILILLGLNIFYLFFNVGWDGITHTIIADRAGLMFVANLPWLYLLAAKNQPIKLLTGSSYENLNLLHRRLGVWMCFLAALHFGGMIWAWYDLLRPLGLSLWRFLTLKFMLFGCGAWVAYQGLWITSLGRVREWWYEVFLGTHVFLQAAALVLLFLHHFRSRWYVGIALALFLLDRVVWRFGVKTTTVRAELAVMEDGETIKVSADWFIPRKAARSLWKRILGWNMKDGWKTSEHVFVTVPAMSMKHRWQFHPMTIASAAPDARGQPHAWFNLIIRAKDGFSRDLLNYAQVHSSTMIRLDGPYGSLHALEMLQASDVAIIVAGGSGIAVAYPMLWSLLHHRRAPSDAEVGQEQAQHVCLIWIVQDASHVSWIGQDRLDELKELGLHLVIPPPSRKGGRPDATVLLSDAIAELNDEEHDRKFGVVVSGPDGLNRTVQNCCARMVSAGKDLEVTVEKFGW